MIAAQQAQAAQAGADAAQVGTAGMTGSGAAGAAGTAGTSEAGQPQAQNTAADLRAQYSGGSVVSQDTVNSVGKQAFFSAQPIDDAVFARIQGKSYANGCTVSLDRLRYVRVLYYGLTARPMWVR